MGDSSVKIWLTPNRLNPITRISNSEWALTEFETNLMEYEFGKEKWFMDMKNRIKSKTPDQIQLDRQLVEAVGRGRITNRMRPTANLELVKSRVFGCGS